MNRPSSPSRTVVIDLPDTNATMKLGAALAKQVRPGVVVALVGELGSGKTTLVRGLAEAMGVDESIVNSPTYLLHQVYPTCSELLIHHFDVYRLDDPDQFEALGVGEIFDSGGVALVEWADKAADSLPFDAWRVELEHVAAGAARRASLRVPDDVAAAVEAAFAAESGS